MVRFGRGEGKSMEDDSGWSEPVNPALRDVSLYGGLGPSVSGVEQWYKVVKQHIVYISSLYLQPPHSSQHQSLPTPSEIPTVPSRSLIR